MWGRIIGVVSNDQPFDKKMQLEICVSLDPLACSSILALSVFSIPKYAPGDRSRRSAVVSWNAVVIQ